MRRAGPILIAVIGIARPDHRLLPGPQGPRRRAPRRRLAHGRDQARASTSRVAFGSSTRRCPRTASRRRPAAMGVLKDIIERRVNTTGVSEPVVVVQGSDRVVIELPGCHRRRQRPPSRRPDRPPRLRPTRGTTQMSDGQALDLRAIPAAVRRRPARVGVDRSGPARRRLDRRLRPQGRRRRSCSATTRPSTSASTSRSPSTAT